MSSESSPSRSEATERLDLESPIPGTWALVGLVVGVHLIGGLYGWYSGFEGLYEALIGGRPDRLRIAMGGQDYSMIWAGDAWQLWTSVLVHTDGLHLLTNAVAVYALGRLLEPWLGARRLWCWFFLGGVLASLSSWGAQVPQSDGASGGAFALLGAAVVIGSEKRRSLVPEDARLIGPVLWFFVALNLVLSVVLPFVDLVAHLAGLLAGILLGGAVGERQNRLFAGLEWFFLGASAILLAIGWFQADMFREHYWKVWMLDQWWYTG